MTLEELRAKVCWSLDREFVDPNIPVYVLDSRSGECDAMSGGSLRSLADAQASDAGSILEEDAPSVFVFNHG